ncbi:MAG: hypothetical protein ACRD2F_12965, partial [Terriglobales bacterium]
FILDYAATEKYESPGGALVPNPRARMSSEFGAICAAVGAAVGAAIGWRHPKTLVYRRESAPRQQRGRAFAAKHHDSAPNRL